MARRTIIVDDLDGKEGDDVKGYTFALDNRRFEIDLSEQNRAMLDEVLRPYIAASREVPKRDRPSRGKRSTTSAASTTAQNGARPGGDPLPDTDRREIRQWAVTNGYDVAERGALPRDVVEAWQRANRGQRA